VSQNTVEVFFYGLFMDVSVLTSKGIEPSLTTIGYVDGFRLRIGRRATLVAEPDSRTYGVLMTVERDAVEDLYADESVADYIPEPVSVRLPGGTVRSAICYNLPPGGLEGANSAYAESLLALATNLGFPAEYLDHIRLEGSSA
jgi:hypothetical protein